MADHWLHGPPALVACPLSHRALIAVVVLAAGASTRMGEPKLLLTLQGKSLVRRVVEEAVASRAKQVVVVTGAIREPIERELAGLPIKLVHNPAYAEGMSTSVRAGLRVVRPEADGALIALGDQPLVDRHVLDALIELFERSGAPIVQPSYAGQPGNPVLWDRRLFGELMAEQGDRGGREILRRRAGEVARLELPDARVQQDVDTPEAYAALLAGAGSRALGVRERPRAQLPTPGPQLPPAAHDHGRHAARFCPRCGAQLEPRTVEGRIRPVCVACDSVFWNDPKVAVAVLIPWEDGVLLGKRAIDPGMGRWSFPSGYVDRGEVLEEAARREVAEETGLDVTISGLVGVYSSRGNPVVLVAYDGQVTGGGLDAGPEVSELGAFPPGRLPTMAFEHDDRIVADWQALRRRRRPTSHE